MKRQEFWCWAPLCHSDAEPGNAEFCLSAHRMERLGSRASYGKRHNLRGQTQSKCKKKSAMESAKTFYISLLYSKIVHS